MFERVFSVPYYGLDRNERVKTGLLLQFFQEAAALHADGVNIGVRDLMERGMTWVLRRYRVRVHRYPVLEDLVVRTWFEPHRNLVSVRAFELRDASGELLADAWSGWIVVDLERGRPVRLDRALPQEYFDATDPIGTDISDDMEAVGTPDAEYKYHVRWHELDMNGHTNHTVYFDWALESVPEELPMHAVPVQLDAAYLAPVPRTNVTVQTRRIRDADAGTERTKFLHTVMNCETGAEAARLAVVWESFLS